MRGGAGLKRSRIGSGPPGEKIRWRSGVNKNRSRTCVIPGFAPSYSKGGICLRVCRRQPGRPAWCVPPAPPWGVLSRLPCAISLDCARALSLGIYLFLYFQRASRARHQSSFKVFKHQTPASDTVPSFHDDGRKQVSDLARPLR